jgi:hypothetical protein
MRLSAVLLSIICAGPAMAASGADGFVALAGGIHYPNGEVRNITDTQYGLHLNLGLGADGVAMVGFPTFEFDWGHITGKGNRLDSSSVMYCERVRLQQGVYVGAGAGTVWNRLVRNEADEAVDKLGIGIRGMVGVTIFRQMYVECAVFYNGKVDGLDANAAAVIAGVRF